MKTSVYNRKVEERKFERRKVRSTELSKGGRNARHNRKRRVARVARRKVQGQIREALHLIETGQATENEFSDLVRDGLRDLRRKGTD